MPVTVPYGIPYPVATDPPNGAAQLQALANSVEDNLFYPKSVNDPPWIQLGNTAMGLASNTSQYLSLTITEQQTPQVYSLVDANNLATTRGGLYEAMVCIRTRATVFTGNGGYVQAYLETPAGVPVFDHLAPTYGADWVDLIANFTFRWSATHTVAFKVLNNAGNLQNFTSSRIFLGYRAA